jgi:hypothetical protein
VVGSYPSAFLAMALDARTVLSADIAEASKALSSVTDVLKRERFRSEDRDKSVVANASDPVHAPATKRQKLSPFQLLVSESYMIEKSDRVGNVDFVYNLLEEVNATLISRPLSVDDSQRAELLLTFAVNVMQQCWLSYCDNTPSIKTSLANPVVWQCACEEEQWSWAANRLGAAARLCEVILLNSAINVDMNIGGGDGGGDDDDKNVQPEMGGLNSRSQRRVEGRIQHRSVFPHLWSALAQACVAGLLPRIASNPVSLSFIVSELFEISISKIGGKDALASFLQSQASESEICEESLPLTQAWRGLIFNHSVIVPQQLAQLVSEATENHQLDLLIPLLEAYPVWQLALVCMIEGGGSNPQWDGMEQLVSYAACNEQKRSDMKKKKASQAWEEIPSLLSVGQTCLSAIRRMEVASWQVYLHRHAFLACWLLPQREEQETYLSLLVRALMSESVLPPANMTVNAIGRVLSDCAIYAQRLWEIPTSRLWMVVLLSRLPLAPLEAPRLFAAFLLQFLQAQPHEFNAFTPEGWCQWIISVVLSLQEDIGHFGSALLRVALSEITLDDLTLGQREEWQRLWQAIVQNLPDEEVQRVGIALERSWHLTSHFELYVDIAERGLLSPTVAADVYRMAMKKHGSGQLSRDNWYTLVVALIQHYPSLRHSIYRALLQEVVDRNSHQHNLTLLLQLRSMIPACERSLSDAMTTAFADLGEIPPLHAHLPPVYASQFRTQALRLLQDVPWLPSLLQYQSSSQSSLLIAALCAIVAEEWQGNPSRISLAAATLAIVDCVKDSSLGVGGGDWSRFFRLFPLVIAAGTPGQVSSLCWILHDLLRRGSSISSSDKMSLLHRARDILIAIPFSPDTSLLYHRIQDHVQKLGSAGVPQRT